MEILIEEVVDLAAEVSAAEEEEVASADLAAAALAAAEQGELVGKYLPAIASSET
ncbi:MAG: hypothetical protein IPM91_02505 [Bacteroidetes bacterium]|nr:hypothetical protein [Bacteroidota bacterium]